MRLLGYLEGELQGRDVAIATLKGEAAKQLLYQAKYGRLGLNDPLAALQRDSQTLGDQVRATPTRSIAPASSYHFLLSLDGRRFVPERL